MIVQTSEHGARHFVTMQLEHSSLSGQFATAWGNGVFNALIPGSLMRFVVNHHDQGWDVIDAEMGRDPTTGLPYNLVQTPLPQVIRSGSRGPDFNEKHHPFCGLLSSMHTYGLYCGRYGLSDKIFVDTIAAEHRPAVDDLLIREKGRQAALRSQLAKDPEAAPWVEESALMHNYKLLQFFDTLALYFNCTHEKARGATHFLNVPRSIGDDVEIRVRRVGTGVYEVDPFPFAKSGVQFTWRGRWMSAHDEQTSLPQALEQAPEASETVRLVAP